MAKLSDHLVIISEAAVRGERAALLPRCCRSNRLREPREISIGEARGARGTASISVPLIGRPPRRVSHSERRGEDAFTGPKTWVDIKGREEGSSDLDRFNKRKR